MNTHQEKYDLLEVERYFGSNQFTIPTRQIMELNACIEEWLAMNACGGIVYGHSRSGKTRAILYITEQLKKKYGVDLPVYTYCATDHVPTNKTFYSELLVALYHEDPNRGTAVQMRERIVNRIYEQCLHTKYGRAVLFIDEAYLLSEKEYLWLIDIYNQLAKKDIILTVFLFGTKELKDQKTGFIRSGKQQIILRFMSNEYEFKGISDPQDMVVCMASLDKAFRLPFSGTKVTLSKIFFPEAAKDNLTLQDFAADLWDAFEKVKQEHGIKTNEILMKHFMDTVLYCLKNFGAYKERLYTPTQKEWEFAIEKIGFTKVFERDEGINI